MLVLNDHDFLYLQIYDYFKEEILLGRYHSDDKLPSKRLLAKTYDIAISSVENAYAKLLEEGYIYSKERQGYFVADVGSLHQLESKPLPQKKEKPSVDYDFSYNGVAQEGFPFKIFRKMANLIIDDTDLLHPVDYQGYFPLRAQIANYLKRSRGVDTTPDNIIISSGSEYLFQIIFKLVKGSYAIESPGYDMLPNIMRANGITYTPIPVDDMGITIDALKGSKASICTITPAHQFPTGIIMTMKRRIELLNLSSIDYIIEDDYDSEFKYANRPVPALKSIDTTDKVIYMGSFSKSISPAFRVSYMVLPKNLLESYHSMFDCFVCPVSIIVQKILTEFIETGEFEKHLNRMRKIYAKKRQLIVELLKDRKDIVINGADAGLHVVLSYPNTYKEEDIVKKALEKKVGVYGLKTYGIDDNTPRILLGFATLSEEDIREGIMRLKTI